MKSTSLKQVSDKLLELNSKYSEIYPKFYLAELKYTSTKAKLMRQQYGNFSSQPVRDAAVEELLSETDEYVEYNKLFPEMNMIDSQIKIYMQLSRNLNNIGWGEVNHGR